MLVIEAADGTGRTREVAETSWKRWKQATDATGKVIPGHKFWGRVPAFVVGSPQAPKPLVVNKTPVVPEEVRVAAPVELDNARAGVLNVTDPNAIPKADANPVQDEPVQEVVHADAVPKKAKGKPGRKPKHQ